jgi:hypothetical protein
MGGFLKDVSGGSGVWFQNGQENGMEKLGIYFVILKDL